MVIINVLLNLGLSFSCCRFIDWHFDIFIIVSDYNRPKGRIFSMDHLVIDCPETVKTQSFFIVFDNRFHLQIGLISNDVINALEFDRLEESIKNFLVGVRLKSWQERSSIVNVLNESVGSFSIGSNC